MVVRMRRNRSQTAKRRSHHALSSIRASVCECGALKKPHTACQACGKYNGKVVIDVVERAAREARRLKRREKELRASGHADRAEKEKESQSTSA